MVPKRCLCHVLQLFWPDDKMWYLVEIHSILPKMRTAKCVASLCTPAVSLGTKIDVVYWKM